MAAEANSTANVSFLKGVKGGYFLSAPKGTPLPSTPNPTLDNAFVNLGYIPEDGAPSFSNEMESETFKDVNGQIILVQKKSEEESFTVTLCEIKPDVWREFYGQGNVTVSEDGKTMTAKHLGADTAERVYVFLFLDKEDKRWCRVIPKGVIQSLGEETPFDGPYGREITIGCVTDDALGSIVDYVQIEE